MEPLTARLKRKAQSLGFARIGITPARPGRRLDAYMRWIAAEFHGEMGYLARPDRINRRLDLSVILPGVRSLICVGLDYYTQPVPAMLAGDPGRGRISNYAWGLDYHDVMTPRLEELAAWLRRQTAGNVATRVYVDTGAILERDHAESAGMGFTGKNTMLIAPRGGSWFFLGELLTTEPLAFDAPRTQPTCGTCRRCLTVCPTNAFPAPYVLDARRCISYLTIELKGWIPAGMRPLMGNWIYGCDLCQEVCPFNRFAPVSEEGGFAAANWDMAVPPLLDLLVLNEAGFAQRFAQSPVKRIKHGRFMRNVCVAAGNWGNEAAVEPLARLLESEEAIVRGHAAWALHQIGGRGARRELVRALKQEDDPEVRLELAGAIKAA